MPTLTAILTGPGLLIGVSPDLYEPYITIPLDGEIDDFVNYTGSGMINFGLTLLANSSDTLTGELQGSITYFFTPVPEPSTWAMMLLGFAGLGFAGIGRREGPLRLSPRQRQDHVAEALTGPA